MNQDEHREVVGRIMDRKLCCKRVPPDHPANHNKVIREEGRCYCVCHGSRVR